MEAKWKTKPFSEKVCDERCHWNKIKECKAYVQKNPDSLTRKNKSNTKVRLKKKNQTIILVAR